MEAMTMILKKHKSLLIITIVFLTLCIIYLIINNTRSKNFSDFIGPNEQKISKVSMMNGSTGKEVCTNYKTKIKELITLLNNSHYKKTSDQKILIGYSFSYIFYVGNENILEITDIGNKIRINGIYYDVVERNFSRIKDWYNSL
ncbi:hypothetical protein G8V03_13895 [Clostridium botulinum D/C]|nr:hypothetical protein [Clostridium botulinum D/C]MCD3361003.1 hypothetical protein [Clostridium botulinum D/C]MCD3366744.1 hypothetical protein [Clostridium botulinum D/C]